MQFITPPYSFLWTLNNQELHELSELNGIYIDTQKNVYVQVTRGRGTDNTLHAKTETKWNTKTQ